MSKDREIEYLHVRCSNLNDKLSLALGIIKELVSIQTQKLSPYYPEGQHYQDIYNNCDSIITSLNSQWDQVELDFQDVINNSIHTEK